MTLRDKVSIKRFKDDKKSFTALLRVLVTNEELSSPSDFSTPDLSSVSDNEFILALATKI